MPNTPRPTEIAYFWVTRATSVAFAMVSPGVLGMLADHYLGITPVLSILGFVFGFAYGLWLLIRIASQSPATKHNDTNDNDQGH